MPTRREYSQSVTDTVTLFLHQVLAAYDTVYGMYFFVSAA
jgi:hypothetical protein